MSVRNDNIRELHTELFMRKQRRNAHQEESVDGDANQNSSSCNAGQDQGPSVLFGPAYTPATILDTRHLKGVQFRRQVLAGAHTPAGRRQSQKTGQSDTHYQWSHGACPSACYGKRLGRVWARQCHVLAVRALWKDDVSSDRAPGEYSAHATRIVPP